jgi:hypothetical protein
MQSRNPEAAVALDAGGSARKPASLLRQLLNKKAPAEAGAL